MDASPTVFIMRNTLINFVVNNVTLWNNMNAAERIQEYLFFKDFITCMYKSYK